MGQPADARPAVDPQAIHQGAAAQGPAPLRVPARHQRNRESRHHAARWRRRSGALRLESALHAGRSGRLPGEGLPASPSSPSRARTTTPTTRTSTPPSTIKPQITMDDGADLVTMLLTKRKELLGEVIGGTEETTTGVIRLRAMAKDGRCKYPIIAVNDAAHQAPLRQSLRHRAIHDRRHPPRHQSAACRPELRRRRLRLVRPRRGACARKGLGADVIVTEINPVRALEAVMDGFRVMPMAEAAQASATSSSPSPAISPCSPPSISKV